MITSEEWKEWIEKDKIPEDRLLSDDMNLIKIWNEYDKCDDKSICGQGTKDINEINFLNVKLAESGGIHKYLPAYGSVVDIGAGYNAIQTILNTKIRYYPCDLIKRTPTTIEINGDLPFENESISTVISCNMFQHITPKQRQKYINESYRILGDSCLMFIASSMDFGNFKPNSAKINNLYYACTGTYAIPLPTYNDVKSWVYDKEGNIRLNLINYSCRSDGFCGLWFQKTSKKENDESK